MVNGDEFMQTFFILLVIVFTFCISIGLMIYDKDSNGSDNSNEDKITDEVEKIFDDINEKEDEEEEEIEII